ncbi:alpha/beta fold hydrolase [Nitrincola sp.]|uniref:alpha/beta fold hydrolase n=1 Tax=Nitrincola sp. TaxID=1926584 RepID=UPI003A947BD4
MQAQHHFVQCNHLEVHVTCWGDQTAPAVVLWHGLTRTGRDFDELALTLAQDYFVLCPDTPGRGHSQWSPSPEEDYVLPRYVEVARQLLDAFHLDQCIWVGTSMGGLIGMLLAAEEDTPICALLVNDVGPELPDEALQRIRDYISIQPGFNSLTEFEQWLQAVYVTFGKNTIEFWRRMAITSSRRLADGRYTLHYDPALVKAFQVDDDGQTLWPQWQAIRCPLMIVRGAESDLLSASLLESMQKAQPTAESVIFSEVGHAPTLVSPEQQTIVVDWVRRSPVSGR